MLECDISVSGLILKTIPVIYRDLIKMLHNIPIRAHLRCVGDVTRCGELWWGVERC